MKNMLCGIACIAVTSFSATASAAWERISADEIKLSGSIEKGSFDEYMELARDGYKTLILSSLGGSPAIALRIAEDVQARDVAVVVRRGCFSACANYLAIAGDSLTVECGAILGWHGTLSDADEVRTNMERQGLPAQLIELTAEFRADFKAREREFYRRAGVDYRLLADSVDIVIEDKLAPSTTYDFDEETGDFSSATTSAAPWIPTPSVLAEYGIDVRGFECPYTERDIRAWFEKRGDTSTRFSSRGRREPLNDAK